MMELATWWRQFSALMRKNRIIKLRLWRSSLAEILLPVAIMLIMVGLRKAITKDTYGTDLHYRVQDQNLYTYDDNYGPFEWNATRLADYLQIGSQSNDLGVQNGLRTIEFLGNASEVSRMADDFRTLYPGLASSVQTRFLTSGEAALEKYVHGSSYETDGNLGIAVAVVINRDGSNWHYTVRGNDTGDSSTASTIDTDSSTVNTLQVEYDGSDWATLMLESHHLLQDFIETWIINSTTGVSIDRTVTYQPFPTPGYISDGFADIISSMLGIFFTITYMWPLTRLIKGIVEEKQLRIKEGMRMMGLIDSAHFASWFTTYLLIFATTSALITAVTSSTVYSHSNKAYVFVFFFLFSMTCFAFCWLVSVFFSRTQVASTFAAILFLGAFAPYYAVEGDSSSSSAKTGVCILSPACFGLGAVVMQKLESAGTGVTSATVGIKVGHFSYNNAISMFIIDFFIYMTLAAYFSQVVPSEWGTHKKWYFFLQPSYWFEVRNSLKQHPKEARVSIDDLEHSAGPSYRALEDATGATSYFEPVSDAIRASLGVSIQNLRRTFQSEDGPEFVAVKGMNLDLYDGQILALLGHNGAGKTTSINMLSGMIAPTSGDAYVYGSSITHHMKDVRKILGVCPQHNILYEDLTVQEHLELFAEIKGVPPTETAAQIHDMIEQVGLTEKVNDRSAALSGGMQRKLSVAIALLGDSKIVFLDEPTSGMDPYSRRATWDLLKKKKEGRVIILTTHFMDEADQLGDRVAIMAKGEVKCCGSSLFLKNRYGVGYTLTIVKSAQFDEAKVTSLVQSHVPSATSLSNIAGEISFRLPFQSSASFADLFDTFDGEKTKLGLDSYGISVTTLEEVFLRVGHEGEDSDSHDHQCQAAPQESRLHSSSDAAPSSVCPDLSHDVGASRRDPNQPLRVKGVNTGHDERTSSEEDARVDMLRESTRFDELRIPGKETPMFSRHVHALLMKRWWNAKRDRRVFFWTLLYPFLICLVFIGVIKSSISSTHPNLDLNAGSFGQTSGGNSVPYVSQSSAALNLFASDAADGTTFANYVAEGKLASGASLVNMSQVLLDELTPTPLQVGSRYNAFFTDFQSTGSNSFTDDVTIFFNTSAQWSSSFGINLYNNQVLKQLGWGNTTIAVSIHPLPTTLNLQVLLSSLMGVIVAISFAYIPANFIGYAVKEEQDKVKHQQLISGVSALSYWTSNFLWDFCNYAIMGLLCLLIFKIWSLDGLIGENAGATFLALLLFGLSVIPFNYTASLLFDESTNAQKTMLLFYIITGALLLIAITVLSMVNSTRHAAYYLRFICRLLPQFCFGEAISNLLTRTSITLWTTSRGIWDMEITGYPLLFMTWEAVFYSGVVLIYEKVKATPSLMTMIFGNPHVEAADLPEEDEDVINERARLQTGNGQSDTVKVMGLRKVYKGRLGGGNKIAVQDLWLGIPEGQCFGYLGINGAGKTTTLKMLGGDIIPGSGTATLNGFDILKQQNDVRRLIGYCPQFDALIDTLTGREHLILFARIKGVPESLIPEYVEHLILKLGLQEGIADKQSKGYSGGNKRKLCVGMALIGNPPIVFLDEPSTGMDPGSRRFMWNLIASTMKNRSVILTTHSMEECEALCHRVGIMVGGRLRCLGSTTHLKQRYGDGYQLDINVPEQSQAQFRARIEQSWPQISVLEEHGSSFKFRLPRASPDGRPTSIGTVFRVIEGVKSQFDLKDYSVSETTLEQIFIGFASQQEEEKGPVAGLHK